MSGDAEREYLRGLDAAGEQLHAAQELYSAHERAYLRAEARGLVRDLLLGIAAIFILAAVAMLSMPELPAVIAQMSQTAQCPPPAAKARP